MKNTLYVMCGLPGSGKSTIAKSFNCPVISSDEVRAELYGDASIQGNPVKVFSKVNSLVREGLKKGNVVYDATSITPRTRRKIIKTFPGMYYVCVFAHTAFDTCVRRNNSRDRVVPMEVLERMRDNFIAPSIDEGFDEIYEIWG